MLNLEDVQAATALYHRHAQEVDDYITRWAHHSAELRKTIEAQQGESLGKKLMERREVALNHDTSFPFRLP